ncbi:MAG: hypothetical protein ACP6KW_03030 [Candidatus Thorarchaeota archaeon]
MARHELPLGVLILALIQALQALVLMVPGALLMIIPIIGWIFGIPMFVIGFFLLFIAWGLFTLQSWAHLWAVVMNILGLVIAALNANVLGVVLSLLIVLYLQSDDIKRRFT